MLTRYCLFALAALAIIVESTGHSRRGSRRANIDNKYTPKYKNNRHVSSANINSRVSSNKNNRNMRITPKRSKLDNKQVFYTAKNRSNRSQSSNSGMIGNNFGSNHVEDTTNTNRIRAKRYAKVTDNEQSSKQTVSSHNHIMGGNDQSDGADAGSFFGGFPFDFSGLSDSSSGSSTDSSTDSGQSTADASGGDNLGEAEFDFNGQWE